MRYLSRFALVFLLLAVGCAAPQSVTLRVLSYNIHHGEGMDGKLDLERIARVIRESNADLVSVQEVDRNTPRTQRVDQPARLAELTGMHAVFEKNIDLEGGEYGNMILSRWPVESYGNYPLPLVKASERRGLLVAHVRVGGMHVAFGATHFDASREPDDRRAQAAAIKRFVQQHPEWAIILAGDLNAKPSDPVIGDVFSVLKDTCPAGQTDALTIPVKNPKARIDYILHSPGPMFAVLDYRVIPETVASDHRPVAVTLRVSPAH
jgi:endonuclease/exonuclease/phosphatase family metal-dependent hydrolase